MLFIYLGLLENFRVAEDMPVESDLVNQALDKVQIQVEDYYRANRQQVEPEGLSDSFE
jgi:preprotein translocase subunit SecA